MIEILKENDQYIVVNKPSNMPAQKDFSRTPDMLSAVEDYLGCKAFLIHRLDRHVAGPVVLAKTKASAGALNKQLNGHGFSKIYKAVVVHSNEMELKLDEVISLEHYLKKEKAIAKVISTDEFQNLNNNSVQGYKSVQLKYKCLQTKTYGTMNLSVLEIELITGRFHQIRSQLKYVGLPILGDPKYGETIFNEKKYSKIGLQSTVLKFTDPKNNKVTTSMTEHYNEPFNLFK